MNLHQQVTGLSRTIEVTKGIVRALKRGHFPTSVCHHVQPGLMYLKSLIDNADKALQETKRQLKAEEKKDDTGEHDVSDSTEDE